jgi:hypothetical protein
MTPPTLYTLDKAAFVLVFTGHALAASRAAQVADLDLANFRYEELAD